MRSVLAGVISLTAVVLVAGCGVSDVSGQPVPAVSVSRAGTPLPSSVPTIRSAGDRPPGPSVSPTTTDRASATGSAAIPAGGFMMTTEGSRTVTVYSAAGAQLRSVELPEAPSSAWTAYPELPTAGSLYAVGADTGDLTVIDPQGKTTTMPGVGDEPFAAYAPPGLPNAGSVYLWNSTGFGMVVRPDGKTESFRVPSGEVDGAAFGPAGAANAGRVYVAAGCRAYSVDPSDNSVQDHTVEVTGPGSQQICPTTVAVSTTGADKGTAYFGPNDQRAGAAGDSVTTVDPTGKSANTHVGPGPLEVIGMPDGETSTGAVYVITREKVEAAGGQKMVVRPKVRIIEGGKLSEPVEVASDFYSSINPATGELLAIRVLDGGGQTVSTVGADGTEVSQFKDPVANFVIQPAGSPTVGAMAYVAADGQELVVVRPDGTTANVPIHDTGALVTLT